MTAARVTVTAPPAAAFCRVGRGVVLLLLFALSGCVTTPAEPTPVPPPQPVAAPPLPAIATTVAARPAERAPTPVDPELEELREAMSVVVLYNRLAAASPDEQRRELSSAQQLHQRRPGDLSRLRLAVVLSVPGTPFRDDARALALLEQALEKPGTSPLRQVAAILQSLIADRVKALREEQRRTEEVQQKLDALRTIERNLLERGQKQRAR